MKPGRFKDSKVRAKAIALAKKGLKLKDVAYGIGVTPNTLGNWLRRGEVEKERGYLEFATKLRAAQSKGAEKNLDVIQKASKQEWRAAAWILERSYSYTREEQVKLSGGEDVGLGFFDRVFNLREAGKGEIREEDDDNTKD